MRKRTRSINLDPEEKEEIKLYTVKKNIPSKINLVESKSKQIRTVDPNNSNFFPEIPTISSEHKSQDDNFFINDSQKNYDEYRYPASMQHAIYHQKASKFQQPFKKSKMCPCCHKHIEKKVQSQFKKFSLLCDLDLLECGGCGVPLFFRYIKDCTLIMLFSFFIQGFYVLYQTINSNKCLSFDDLRVKYPSIASMDQNGIYRELLKNDYKHECVLDPTIQYTIVNLQDHTLETHFFLFLVSQVVIMIFLHMARYRNRVSYQKYDLNTLSPEDFTVVVRNLPLDFSENIEQDIKIEFEKKFRECFYNHKKTYPNDIYYQDLEIDDFIINRVLIMYNPEQYLKIQQKLVRALENLQSLETSWFKKNKKKINDARNLVEKYKLELMENKLKNTTGTTQNFCGSVLIIFEKVRYQALFLKYYETSITQDWKSFVNKKITHPDLINMGGRTLVIHEAYHPHHILWFNQHYIKPQQLMRQFIGLFFQFLIIAVSFLMIHALFKEQKKYIDSNSSMGDVFPFLVAIVIVVIDWTMRQVMSLVSDFEKHHSQGSLNSSIASKTVWLQFVNSSVITFANKMEDDEIFTYKRGLVQQQAIIFFTIVYIPSLVQLLHFPQIFRKFMRRFYLKRIEEKKTIMYQKELNEIMEDENFDIVEFYCYIQKSMFFSAMYFVVIPWGSIVIAFGFILFYWVIKNQLLRHSSLKKELSYKFNCDMQNQLDYIIPIMTFGYLFIVSQIRRLEYNPALLCSVILSLFSLFVPQHKVNEQLFPLKRTEEYGSFSESEYLLESSYSANNPLMYDRSYLEEARNNFQELQQRAKKQNSLRNNSIFSNPLK